MVQQTGAYSEIGDSRARMGAWLTAIDERWPGARRRAAGIAVALALETGLLLLLLTLGAHSDKVAQVSEALTTFSVAPEEPPAPEPETEQAAPSKPKAADAVRPRTTTAPVPEATSRPAPPIPLPLATAAAPSPPPAPPGIHAVIRDDGEGAIGPGGSGARPGDSQRISGSGPHGEPLYAARWYREPGPAELAGYLSTATSPGYALINCRTVPDFRVDDCQLVSEYPTGAGLGRAVLAAAWQFRVRPPQVGGRSLVGEWVRIRISYEMNGG